MIPSVLPVVVSAVALLLPTITAIEITCIPWTWRDGPRPYGPHCVTTQQALETRWHRPRENEDRAWSRLIKESEQNTTQMHLPHYWVLMSMESKKRLNCEFAVDSTPDNPDATETFKLQDLAIATSALYHMCTSKGQNGRATLGQGGTVAVQIKYSGPSPYLFGQSHRTNETADIDDYELVDYVDDGTPSFQEGQVVPAKVKAREFSA